MNEYMRKRQQQILDGRPLKPKEKKPIAKKSEKRIQKEKEEKERLGGDDTDLVKFYKAAMKRMGNKCYECGRSVENKVYKYAIQSICHILPKRENMCPSVKDHPANWITLCPDHHYMFDNIGWEDRETWGCWETIKERLIHLWEALEPSERRHFPENVRNYIESQNPF